MLRLSSLLIVAAMLCAWASLAPAGAAQARPEKCIAVFEFELLDMSLEGEIRGTNGAELQRLGHLTDQLRTWLAGDNHRVCDMNPIAVEARAANLTACGCIQRLARSVNGKLAFIGAVHKVSNLILNIRVDVFDVDSGKRVIQLNADIRSNSDRSWMRGLAWLIEHRLSGALGSLESDDL
jgi:hypothetical protein